MKIALYKMFYGEGLYSSDTVGEYRDEEKPRTNWIRLSEPIEVEFQPLKTSEVIEAQLKAIDSKEQEIRNNFQRALDSLNDERRRIQALPNLAVQP